MRKMRKRNNKVNANHRNGPESRGVETANLGDIREHETVIADHRTVAQNRIVASARAQSNVTGHPSSPQRSSGPLKILETDGKFEVGPSFWAAAKSTFGTSDGALSAELLLQVTRALPHAEPLDPHGNHALWPRFMASAHTTHWKDYSRRKWWWGTTWQWNFCGERPGGNNRLRAWNSM
jgi:hypothetical protein